MPYPFHRRTAIQSLGSAFVVSLAGAGQAQVAPIAIDGAADLEKRLKAARGGEVFELAPGDYDRLDVSGAGQDACRRPIVLRPRDRADPPRFRRMEFEDTCGFVLDGLVFDYAYRDGHPHHARLVRFRRCTDITLTDCVFSGDVVRGTDTPANGYPTAYALTIGGCRNIRVEGCCLSHFMRGIIVSGSSGVVVQGNDLGRLRSDGINIVAVQDLQIVDNYLHDFIRAPGTGDHADMIQFWTNRSTVPTTDVMIRGNVLRSGAGGTTQSIFMRNEEVDKGRAGEEMFYRDIRIEENVIVNGHLHGITLGEAVGVTVRANTLLRNQVHVTNQNRARTVNVPHIRMAAASRDVEIIDNIAAGYFPKDRPGWRVSGNLVLQDMTPTKPGYYHGTLQAALTGDPLDLSNYRVLAGSAADRPELGAPRLRPGANLEAFPVPRAD